ncbi:MAG: hypothetical protein ACLPID_00040 [Beijerinckiaceae bacterium]
MNNKAVSFRRPYGANYQRVRGLLARMAGPQAEEDPARAIFANAVKARPAFRSDVRSEVWCFLFSAASLLRIHE